MWWCNAEMWCQQYVTKTGKIINMSTIVKNDQQRLHTYVNVSKILTEMFASLKKSYIVRRGSSFVAACKSPAVVHHHHHSWQGHITDHLVMSMLYAGIVLTRLGCHTRGKIYDVLGWTQIPQRTLSVRVHALWFVWPAWDATHLFGFQGRSQLVPSMKQDKCDPTKDSRPQSQPPASTHEIDAGQRHRS